MKPQRRLSILTLPLAIACADAACADLIFASGFETPACSHYVAGNGNDANDGSLAAPWRSLQHGVDTVSAGAVVCVRGGIYHERVTISHSGNPVAGPITLRSMPGESAVLDGTGVSLPGEAGLITVLDASHVVVRGFELRNDVSASVAKVPIGILISGAGSHVEVLDNHIHDIRNTAPGCSANAYGLKVEGTRASQSINQLLIAGNEIDHLVTGCSESLALNGNVEYWVVRDNHVHHVNNIGIDAIGFEGTAPDPAYDQARNGVIAGNQVHDVSSWGNPAYGNEYAAGGIYVDGGHDIVIERNLVHHADLGIEIAGEHAGTSSHDILVRNNLIHSSHSAGISIGGYDAAVGGSERVTIVGNTLLRNDVQATGSGEFQIQYHAHANRFANNLVVAGVQGLFLNAFTGDSPDPVALDHNLYWNVDGSDRIWIWQGAEHDSFAAWRSASGQDVDSLMADPRLLDPATADVCLQPGSPALDAGIDLGVGIVGALDLLGHPRVRGADIDIGACEQ